ncbi:MAG: hypothetical protein ACRCW6_02845 [Mycoplasmoidaceae bacterium]
MIERFEKKDKIFTNLMGILTLDELKLDESDAVIIKTEKSFSQLLIDFAWIQEVKKLSESNKKIKYFYVVNEDIGDELNVEDMPQYKSKNRTIRKVFKKNKNIYFFIKNITKTDFEIPFTLNENSNILNIEENIDKDDRNLNIDNDDISKISDSPSVSNDLNTIANEEFIKRFNERKLFSLTSYNNKIDSLLDFKNKYMNETPASIIELEKKVNMENEENNRDLSSNYINDEIKISMGYAIKDEDGNIHYTKDSFNNEYLIDKSEKKIAEKLLELTTNNDNLGEKRSDIYSLKSFFDFIWRMFIINCNESDIDDLLYYIGMSLPNINKFQSNIIRKLVDNSNSLFDLIVKIDFIFKYDGSLFYNIIASFFVIKDDKAYINKLYFKNLFFLNFDKFDDFSQIFETLINDIKLYKEKIIYSHYIEFVNIYKSEFYKIKNNILLSDIRNVIFSRNNYYREQNIFIIILKNIISISKVRNIDLFLMSENPEMAYDIKNEIDQNITKAFLILLNEIKNYILLDISNYKNIYDLYIELLKITVDKIISNDSDVKEIEILLSESISDDLSLIINHNINKKEDPNFESKNNNIISINSDLANKQLNENIVIDQKIIDKNNKPALVDFIHEIIQNKEDYKNNILGNEEIKEYIDNFESRIENNFLKISQSHETYKKNKIKKEI